MTPTVKQATTFAIALLTMMLLGSRIEAAETMRIDSSVSAAGSDEPVSKNYTLFDTDVVYDFTVPAGKVTILDQKRREIVVIDSAKRTSTRVSLTTLVTYGQQVRQAALSVNDGLLRFCAQPSLRVVAGESENEWVFTNPLMQYQVTAPKSENATLVAAYRDFADANARLNMLMQSGVLPSFPRIHVNNEIATRGAIPTKVQLTIPAHRLFGNREVSLESTHKIRWGLTNADHDEIKKAQDLLVDCQKVPWQQFANQRAVQSGNAGQQENVSSKPSQQSAR